MRITIKDALNISIIIILLVGAYGVWNFVRSYAESIDPSSLRSFTVTGEGKTVAVPDVAIFHFSIITEGGTDLGGLQSKNIKDANSAIAFVKSEGVDSKDIKTTSYNIQPRYQYYDCRIYGPLGEGSAEPCPPPKIVGYTVTQAVQVKVRDFDKTGNILSGVVDRGANDVSGLTFTVDDPTEPETQARTEAIAKAKEKAQAVATAGGFRLGKLISIDEGFYAPVPYYKLGVGGEVASRADTTPPSIEPGSEEVRVNVTLRFAIE
ncbi:MAG: hypothetical protein A3C80_00185 [Candidatus Ryanbacteria bacterium RIFCSPHIGHO2_02_FULL_45_43]|uniref:DUF541 domain-containing protein n=1 Tax=Candidatus Ryanbacteria bacterium RIFCSPHIGHO2_01_45_13 TaxID=1802112 RepID=A0A1G2G1N1_9BACT|nr:MAG: hypothetical protein A2718_01570 [Candidatus Ryanbacteria bacterium RIFCSPHIGHO2_01_FULL_44_130]OGZ43758.1 MAG: hypothetical protein A2W41_04690 [Candidatus Ryanbacteria bacterium RIFCSPHIGHO2_01_45_13]OGZ47700.1 MAG: hypothetical protein A3C80_00185 [Candidatus Ryanbacteria bacterium RIFCSPHIGHO2_02_FULL_45_43]OGZ49596.1 MAG: hypothetical protein A3E55_04185 [Candidatus Ryanbacteria bacterium RIFCSPHIGHO2_12_FULL_44_20]OGZ51278.1 MAG: hypothetical protein A3A17_04510 [Candidatus Ryanba